MLEKRLECSLKCIIRGFFVIFNWKNYNMERQIYRYTQISNFLQI